MLLPDTVPVYVTPPTEPKVIALPPTFPVMCTAFGDDERLMVPSNVAPDCVQVSVNVPLKGPLYRPDQDPARFTAGGGAVGVAVGAAVGVLVAAALVGTDATVGVGVVVPDPPQAASSATTGITVNVRVIRFTPRLPPVFKYLFGNDCRQ